MKLFSHTSNGSMQQSISSLFRKLSLAACLYTCLWNASAGQAAEKPTRAETPPGDMKRLENPRPSIAKNSLVAAAADKAEPLATPEKNAKETPDPKGAKNKPTMGKNVDDLPLPESSPLKTCLRYPAGKKSVINLKPDTNLDELVGFITQWTCRRFVYDSQMSSKKISIQVPDMVTPEDAYRIFLSALESMGLNVQKVGQIYKIVSGGRLKGSTPILASSDDAPNNDQFFTKMFRLKHSPPDDLKTILNSIKGPDADISTASSMRALIITDSGSNMQRWETMIRELDKPMNSLDKLWIIRLDKTVASEVAAIITSLFGSSGQSSGNSSSMPRRTSYMPSSGPPGYDSGFSVSSATSNNPTSITITQVVPDARTNSLLLIASEQAYQLVFALKEQLEAKGSKTALGQVHYYPLQNSTAEGMASILQGLGVQASVSNSGIQSDASSGSSGGTSASPRFGSSSSFMQPPGTPGANPGQSPGPFQSSVRVTADVATNTLIVIANTADYVMLESILRNIDKPRRQVYLQAAVFELTLNKSRDLGISYHGGIDGPGSNSLLLGAVQTTKNGTINPANSVNVLGFMMGLIGPAVDLGPILGLPLSIPKYGINLKAQQTDTEIQLMQAPFITTMDNTKGTLENGRNLPFPGAITNSLPIQSGQAALSTALQSIDRKDVSLKMNVTPHVNASNVVKLDIDIEISNVDVENFNELGPSTTKQVIKTTSMVVDQKPVVLGGITYDREENVITKVPFLGDIPVLGYLFKSKSKKIQKKMLLIAITPYILRTPEDNERVFTKKWQEYGKWAEALTSLSKLDPPDLTIDYRYQPGVLDEIEKVSREIDAEDRFLRENEKNAEPLPSGPIEPVPLLKPASDKPRSK